MNLSGNSLIEVAAAVATRLRAHAIDAIVVGGSAVTAHAPDVYTSFDVDFVTSEGGRRVSEALAEIGFRLEGRIYVNSTTKYTVDIVGRTPLIEGRVLTEFEVIKTDLGEMRVISLEDAVADRLAAFLYWSDNQSLDVAERVLRGARERIDVARFNVALDALSTPDAPTKARFALARARMKVALHHLERKS